MYANIQPDTVADAQPWRLCQDAQISITWRGQTILSDSSRTYWDSTYYEGTQNIEHYYRLDVEILTTEIIDTTAVICDGSSFVWDRTGEEVSDTAQVYEYTIPHYAMPGCDSIIYRLHLKANVPEYVPVETQYICHGETYTWFGEEHTETGTYYHVIPSVNGCDSIIYTLNLESQAAMYYIDTTFYLCDGETQVVWKEWNKVYTHAGIYLDTLRAAQGCDSIIARYNVIEHHLTNADPEDVSIYRGDPGYPWHGSIYTEEGTYTCIDTYRASGCDSIIYTLNLTLLDRTMVVEEVEDVVCSGTDYLHDGKHIITGHTEWSDTIVSYYPGTDKVTKYVIDVYELSFPNNFMAGVTVDCHSPVIISAAKSTLENYIDTTENYAPNVTVYWLFNENDGMWQTLDTLYAISSNDTVVGIMVEVITDCGTIMKDSTYKVCNGMEDDLLLLSNSSLELLPNVAHANEQVVITGVSDNFISITHINGMCVASRTPLVGNTFYAPSMPGTYFVNIEQEGVTYHRVLIVYP